MYPAPTLIRKCAACGKLVAEGQIASGNTFGATFWTDGKMDAPMLPDEPELVKCPHCKELVWLSTMDEVGQIEPFETDSEKFKDVLPFRIPTTRDLFKMLWVERDSLRRIKYLRIRAWWAGNNKRRKGKMVPFNKEETFNLGALLFMLKESKEDDRIMKAEVLRELGRFDEALALLSHPFSEEFIHAAEIIRSLTVQKDTFVRLM